MCMYVCGAKADSDDHGPKESGVMNWDRVDKGGWSGGTEHGLRESKSGGCWWCWWCRWCRSRGVCTYLHVSSFMSVCRCVSVSRSMNKKERSEKREMNHLLYPR